VLKVLVGDCCCPFSPALFMKQVGCPPPRVLGLVLFSCGANRFIYQLLSRLGITVAYSTINNQLHKLADTVVDSLKQLGGRIKRKEVSVVWIYDNIQRNYVPSNKSITHRGQMRTGTAATVLVMEDVPEGSMDPTKLTSRLHLRSNFVSRTSRKKSAPNMKDTSRALA
jgi:hypothetical protein